MDWWAVFVGVAITAIAALEYAGVLTADRDLPFVLGYGLLLIALGVGARETHSRATVRLLIRSVVVVGFMVGSFATFGPHPARAVAITSILSAYLIVEFETGQAAFLMGAMFVVAGLAGALGFLVSAFPKVDVMFGVALMLFGVAMHREAWRPHRRAVALALLVAALGVGLATSGLADRLPLAINLTAIFAMRELFPTHAGRTT